MESAELPQAAFDFWPLLSQWLGQKWPWLCPLGAVVLALIFRNWLLKKDAGKFWRVPAAFLPSLIPFARQWDQQVPAPLKGFIVPALLLAIAGLQLYGQKRDEGYRKTADDAVEQQGIELRGLVDTVKQQGARINRIGAGVDSIGAGVEKQGADLRRIADGIGAIASQEEETQGEDEMEDRDD